MAQTLTTDFPINPSTTSGTALADILNRFQQAVFSTNRAATQPNPVYAGMLWLDTSAGGEGIVKLRNAANAAWLTLFNPAVPPASAAGGTFTGNITVAPAAGVAWVQVKGIAGQSASLQLGANAQVIGTQSLDLYQDATNIAHLNQRAAQALVVYTAATERARLDTYGLRVAAAVQAGDGTALVPAFTFTSDTNTGMYRSAADTLAFAANGVYQGAFNATGLSVNLNLGVGSSITANGNIAAGAAITAGTTISAGTDAYVHTNTGKYFAGLGSAGAPSFTFTQDAATGIYRASGQNGMGFAVSGNTELSIVANLATFTTALQSASWACRTASNWVLYSSGVSRYIQWDAGGNYLRFDTNTGDWNYFTGGTNFSTVQASGGNLLWRTGTAAKPSGGPWVDVSDARIKTNVRDYPAGLEQVLALQPRLYNYVPETGRDITVDHVGLIAQEAQPVMPEMVSEAMSGFPELKLEEGEPPLLQLDANALTYALVNAIKALHQRITTLEAPTP